MYVGGIRGWAQEVADRLTGAGISTAVEPRNAHPPGGLVVVRGIERRSSVLSRVRADVLLIAPGVGNGDAMGWLYDALPKAWKALDRRPDAQLVVWVSPHAGTQLLALLMEHTDDMTIEEAS